VSYSVIVSVPADVTITAKHALTVTILDLEVIDPTHPTFWDSSLDRGCEVRIMRITIKEDG
jgi:hypothetical protein